MTRVLVTAFFIMAALSLLPQAAAAQGYQGVMSPQGNYQQPRGTTPTQQSDTNNVDDYSSRTDHGYGGAGASYDQMLQTQSPAASQGQTGDALQDKIRAKREEMVRALKANSDRVLNQQKQRAWEQANPGKPYPGANANNPDNYTDDGSANYDTPDANTAAQDNGPADVGPGSNDNATQGDVGGGGMEGDADSGGDVSGGQ